MGSNINALDITNLHYWVSDRGIVINIRVWVHGLDFHVQVHTVFDTHNFAF